MCYQLNRNENGLCLLQLMQQFCHCLASNNNLVLEDKLKGFWMNFYPKLLSLLPPFKSHNIDFLDNSKTSNISVWSKVNIASDFAVATFTVSNILYMSGIFFNS